MQSILSRYRASGILCGFVSTAMWSGVAKALVLLVTFYCSNTLTKQGFGEYSFIKNTLNVLLVICATNFSSLAAKFAAESMVSVVSLKRLYILFIFVVSIGIVFGISLLAIPLTVVQSFTGGESVAYFVKVMGGLLPIFIIQPVVASMLRGYQEFNKVGIYEAVMAVFYMLITVVCTKFWDYRGAVYSILSYYAISSIVGVVVLFKLNIHTHYIKKVDEFRSEYVVLWNMVFPVFMMSFIEVPLTWFAQAEIGRRTSYAMVAALSVIMSIRYIVQIFPTYFYQAFIPYATQLFVLNKHNDYFEKYRVIVRTQALVQVIIIPLLVIFGRFFLSLYGKPYIEYYSSFVVSLIAIPLLLYSALFKTNMLIREHQQLMLQMSIFSSLAFFVSFYIFINLNFNVVNSYLLAQSLQYAVQLLYGVLSYLKDKTLCGKINL